MGNPEDFEPIRQHSKEKFEADKARFLKEAEEGEIDARWKKHSRYHWSMKINGHVLQYWPSRKKFQYRGKTKRGDVNSFIAARDRERN